MARTFIGQPAKERRPLTGLLVVATVLIVPVLLLIVWLYRQNPFTTPGPNPFTDTTQDIDPDSNAHDSLNQDAVEEPLQIFGLNDLNLNPDVAYELQETLPDALSRELVPTFAVTFIQIDKKSIDCASQYDCRFSFYIDSPERYFDYRIYVTNSGEHYSLTPVPFPGVDL